MSKSVGQMFRERVPGRERDAMLSKGKDGQWVGTKWADYDHNVRSLALALDAMGMKKGDSLAIISNTREEWTTIDTAAMSMGLLVVGIYQSLLPDMETGIGFILKDCDAKVVFVEDKKQLGKVEGLRSHLPALKHIFGIMPDSTPAGGKSYGDLVKEGAAILAKDPKRFDTLVDSVKPSELATLVYTSGTTGVPKGAMLTHANFTDTTAGVMEVFEVFPTDRTVLFLPLAHIFARVIQFQAIDVGVTMVFPPYGMTPEILFKTFEETQPTYIASVPRIFEKVYTAAAAKFAEATGTKKKIVDFAMAAGKETSKLRQAGKQLGLIQGFKQNLADKLVFSKVKARFGGKVRFFISGGAPLSREIQEWFHSLDMLILEGFGLTETTAASCVNRLKHFKFGTVGPATPGTQIRIAEDGEIMIKGVGVFQGYFKRPDDTAQVINSEGWFATGDIGELDPDGFLRITDRKKDLIVTAGGKNIAPQYVEAKLKTIPMLSQVMVHGDKRKFVSALVTLNPDEVAKLGMKYEDAVKSDKVREIIEKEIKVRNQSLESYQSVKKFAVLDRDFSIDEGTLTPTLKVKRKAVTERYKSILDAFYTDSKEDAA